MSTESGELLGIDPVELRFPFELNKQISCTLQLTNKTDKQVAFKVKTTSPKKYCVRPNNSMVVPQSKADIVVTMQAQWDAPPYMHCKDKFLVQSAIMAKEIMPKEVTGDMFTNDSGNIVDEVKLKVVYTAPSSSQSEGFEDGNLGSLSYQELGYCLTITFWHFALISDSLQYPPSKSESGSFFARNKRTQRIRKNNL
ncbi:Vesicle-associated protein 1-1 [Zea mays]|uniref:Vesicle-associated protein 1-1 n=1 Tax=Zea mays TaxID=4577 RepID=A0A3L6E8C1_MAIZE|nr:Vesicle-associated protein 1-1 [Zea mays]